MDPRAHRGPLRRLWVRMVGSRAAGWVSRAILWKLDPPLMRLTGGRIRLGLGVPTALLETRGARTGQARSNAVIYFHDGDRVIVIASKLGAPANPAWFYNVRANPDVVLGGEPFRAEIVADEAARRRLWELADSVLPAFAAYRERAARSGREIPIVELTPRHA